MEINTINAEIKEAHINNEQMAIEDMLADIRRQKRELTAEQSYSIAKEDMDTIRKLAKDLWLYTKKTEKAPLEIPFTSVNSKERQLLRSKDYPNEYYDFRYFGVRITIWKHNKDDYSLACIGWYPKNKRFTWRKGYAGKYAYYNRTDELETAIVDWLLAISDFFTSELGITLDDQQKLNLLPRNGRMGEFM